MHVHASDRRLTEANSAKLFVKSDGNTVVAKVGMLTVQAMRSIKKYVRKNYLEMYQKWSVYSDEGFYGERS